MSEIGEEEIARALCRRQIIANLRYDMPRDDEEQFIQRCEDASWNDDTWLGPARAVLALLQPALERARREERERAAKIAEGEVVGMSCFVSKQDWAEQKGLRIAAAIRKGSGE